MKRILNRHEWIKFLGLMILLLVGSTSSFAQNDFAATLEVLNPGVEVLRVNTSNPIPVTIEAIVGVGDIIRTSEEGRARITFFADGTDAILETNTEYHIVEFQGSDEDFQLRIEVLAGQTTHRLNRALGANSSYDVDTPGMTLAARGTIFSIRVEDNGRSAMLVREGEVAAGTEEDAADVPPDYGIRSEVGNPLSDVVYATSFDELDSALDGCAASVSTLDDVRINVRISPNKDYPAIGTIADQEIDTFVGINETGGWYRVDYRGGFGWILSTSASVRGSCAGLRVFPNNHLEDYRLYDELGDSVEVESLPLPGDPPPSPGDSDNEEGD